MPPLATHSTRLPGVDDSNGTSERVSTKGPSTIVAKVTSWPSSETFRSGSRPPALWISTSSRDSPSMIAAATACTDASDDRSPTYRPASPDPAAAICRRAASPRSGSLATIRMDAPIDAKRVAVSNPRPELPPVITTTVPSMRSSSRSCQWNIRRRAS